MRKHGLLCCAGATRSRLITFLHARSNALDMSQDVRGI